MKCLRILIIAVVAWGCATNPATGKRQVILMSEQQEIQIGKDSDVEIRKTMGAYNDQNLQRYVSDIGTRLARSAHRPNLPWTFTVVDEAAVNAFAVPGGFVYLTRGILPFLRNEAELAAVMAHEVGHIDARHSAQQYSNQTLAGGGLALLGVLVPSTRPAQGLASIGLGAAFLKFSRDDELEADQLGVGYSATNGWDPRGMPGLLATLARLDEASGSSRGVPNWALTHPPAADRVTKVQQVVAAAPAGGKATNASQFERYLDGIVFGDSREKGIVRGTDFLHPVLRFAVRFPPGWQVMNSDEQVVARRSESENVAMLLQLDSGTGPIQQMAPASMAKAGWREVSGERTTINGLEAYVGTYQGTMNNTPVTIRAAHVRAGQQVYVVAGVAPTSEFNSSAQTFTRSIETFRTLSREEADRIQPNRVDFYTVRSGDTWESLSRAAGVKASTLAIMNGSDPATAPRPGERIRLVVTG
jgi:predicted Zn-dependent protease